MNHPPYSPDLALVNYLFGPVKVDLGGQKFLADDELKCDILNWLCIRDETVYASFISNLPGWWKRMC